MGHIINPTVFRLGKTANWISTAFSRNKIKRQTISTEDFLVYNYVNNFFKHKIYKKYISTIAIAKLKKKGSKLQKKRKQKKKKYAQTSFFQNFLFKFSHLNISRFKTQYQLNLYFYDRFLQKQKRLLNSAEPLTKISQYFTQKQYRTSSKIIKEKLQKDSKLLVAKTLFFSKFHKTLSIVEKKRLLLRKRTRRISNLSNRLKFKKEYPALFLKRYFLNMNTQQSNLHIFHKNENNVYAYSKSKLSSEDLINSADSWYVNYYRNVFLSSLGQRKFGKKSYRRDLNFKKLLKKRKQKTQLILNGIIIPETHSKVDSKLSQKKEKLNFLNFQSKLYNEYCFYNYALKNLNLNPKLNISQLLLKEDLLKKVKNYKHLLLKTKKLELQPNLKKKIKLFSLYKYKLGLGLLKKLQNKAITFQSNLWFQLSKFSKFMQVYRANLKGNSNVIALNNIILSQTKAISTQNNVNGRLSYFFKKALNKIKQTNNQHKIIVNRQAITKERLFAQLLTSQYYRRLYNTITIVGTGFKDQNRLSKRFKR